MNVPATTLLLSWRNTEDNQLLWRAGVNRGWSVERVRGINVPPIDGRVVIYVESLLAPEVARRCGVGLIGPADEWLPRLPAEYRRRDVWLTALGEVPAERLPLFLKPPNDKSFPAMVYDSVEELIPQYGAEAVVLAATPVQWEVEFRAFCLDRRVRTISPYLRNGVLSKLDGYSASEGELREAQDLAYQVLRDTRVATPRAVVIDVGKIVGKGWAVVEANAAWGSGIYGCDPDEVLSVVEQTVVR